MGLGTVKIIRGAAFVSVHCSYSGWGNLLAVTAATGVRKTLGVFTDLLLLI